MSSTIKIPKFCQHCGHKCASRAYKQRKREEKVQTTLSDQIKSVIR